MDVALRLGVYEGVRMASDRQPHHRLLAKDGVGSRQHVQGHGCGMRESRCGFPWWKRGLGDDRQQGERNLQGGRHVGDRERPLVARCPRAYWQELQDPRELEPATFPLEATVGGEIHRCDRAEPCVRVRSGGDMH